MPYHSSNFNALVYEEYRTNGREAAIDAIVVLIRFTKSVSQEELEGTASKLLNEIIEVYEKNGDKQD